MEHSISFIVLVILISITVFYWSRFYIRGSYRPTFFFLILLRFVVSMLVLVISRRFLTVFLGWEGLGITSFILIIYYQSWSSSKGGMLTLLTNRIGDGVLMGLFSYWFLMQRPKELVKGQRILILVLLITISYTKRAQFPFTSWLPAAMAAPTPVSSLVHSSTLVTAGIWLMIRYSHHIIILPTVWILFGMITLLLARLAALVEIDGKKIVALSTLRQLGLMVISMSLGGRIITLFHLFTHAVAKANLFLAVGRLIHSKFSNQDIRQISNGIENPFLFLSIIIRVMRLRGVVFTSRFFSKDIILLRHYSLLTGVFNWLLLLGVISLTLSYCYKIILLFRKKSELNRLISNQRSKFILKPILLLRRLSLVLGFSYFRNSILINLFRGTLRGMYWAFLFLRFVILSIISTRNNCKELFFRQLLAIDFFKEKILKRGKLLSEKIRSRLFESLYLYRALSPTKLFNVITRSILLLRVVCFFRLLI